jgi:hypothetical protein
MNRPYVAQSSSEASVDGAGGAGGVSASAKPELAGGAAGGGAGADELVLLLWYTPQALPYDGQSFSTAESENTSDKISQNTYGVGCDLGR